MNIKIKLLSFALTLALNQTAHAGLLTGLELDTPILGGNFYVVNDGLVEATFLGSDASYFSTLFMDVPGIWGGVELFNKRTAIGSTISLGQFKAGDELIFRLDVRNTGLSFFVGDGSLNPDNLAHVEAVTSFAGGLYTTTAGFEDLFGGGDLDYNDFMFSLGNVVDPLHHNIPEPGLGFLLSSGLISLVLVRRRNRYPVNNSNSNSQLAIAGQQATEHS